MKVIVIAVVAFVVLIMLACCKVSGDCSREEEKRYGN